MKVCILMGSPRKTGNTAVLLEPFIAELERHHVEHNLIWLYVLTGIAAVLASAHTTDQ
ncbi:MAG: NADPH-dependent reductase [Sporomusa sp.]|nr:NADPH-dependent reductase [Sporomusa sp.]